MGLSYSKATEGVLEIVTLSGELTEIKTATCGHCQRIVQVKPGGDGTEAARKKDEGVTVCHGCWQIICGPCHKSGRCTTILKRIEEIEARDRARRSYESAA